MGAMMLTNDQVSKLKAGEAALTATVQITRATTGKVEEYQLTFKPLPDEPVANDETKGAE